MNKYIFGHHYLPFFPGCLHLLWHIKPPTTAIAASSARVTAITVMKLERWSGTVVNRENSHYCNLNIVQLNLK